MTTKTSAPATAWAFGEIAAETNSFTLSTRNRLVLLGFAHLADEALNSPSGYSKSRTADVAAVTGLGADEVLSAALLLATQERLVEIEDGLGHRLGFRIPESAFQGSAVAR